ncbi:MAG TPA: phosphate uptake regulator PhoU [Desulfobacteria bacterium]|nr:phosphate uptake regulator PhoU [Desulfobacteria bacterium]
MKEEKRKIQLTGGSTYTISLPIKWAREAGVKQGDELSLVQRADKSLVLTPLKEKEEQIKYAELVLSEKESFEGNFRYLIAHYLVGYDVVKLLSPGGFEAEARKRIKAEVRKRLIGMEVVGESSQEIVLKSFLKYEDFTLRDAIRSMYKIIVSMLEDAISALEKSDHNRAKDVIERDNEIDRFYLLTVRQLKAVISDPELAKKIGESRQRDSLGYRIIVKTMERMGDHVESIARNSMMMSSSVGIKSIKEIGTRTTELFTKTLASLSDMNIEKANEAIQGAKLLSEDVESINERIMAEKWSANDKIHAIFIMESLGRIARYCEDIAEVAINLGITVTGESEF